MKKRENAGFEIIACCDLPDTGCQVVIGKRIGSSVDNCYCTWFYTDKNGYNFGCYDLNRTEAFRSMYKRAASFIKDCSVEKHFCIEAEITAQIKYECDAASADDARSIFAGSIENPDSSYFVESSDVLDFKIRNVIEA